jgi:hypothetical protein
MEQDVLYITAETLIKLGITVDESIEYLESKKALTVNPVHVKALQVLKQKPLVSS